MPMLQIPRCRPKYISYGGARLKPLRLCLKYPGIKVTIVIKTCPELQENYAEKRINFPNSSSICFWTYENAKDAERFSGCETDIMFVDYVARKDKRLMDFLTGHIRGVNNLPKRLYFICNPSSSRRFLGETCKIYTETPAV